MLLSATFNFVLARARSAWSGLLEVCALAATLRVERIVIGPGCDAAPSPRRSCSGWARDVTRWLAGIFDPSGASRPQPPHAERSSQHAATLAEQGALRVAYTGAAGAPR